MSDAAAAARSIAPVAAAEAVPWLRLGAASRMLGVDPDTLRRWADEGRVEAYVTPGGHRRFDRRTIERVVASRRTGVRPLASLGAGSDRMARAYRRRYASSSPGERGQAVDTAARDRYRRDGRRLVDALVAHLDAEPTDLRTRDAAELQATRVVDDLARRLAAGGTSLTEAVGLFVASRQPFLAELAGLGRRRALDSVRLAGLYEDASRVLDRLLIRFVATYQEGIG